MSDKYFAPSFRIAFNFGSNFLQNVFIEIYSDLIIYVHLLCMYSDDFIEELINCPKIIVESPKEVKDGTRVGFTKRVFTLVSVDGIHNFNGFITQNLTFQENFSIGLAYNPKEEKGKIVLLRCNGQHGGTKVFPHHAFCHIHKATAERINNNLKPEGKIDITEEYSTIETAIQFFVKRIGLTPNDKQKHFPPPNTQMDLFTS